MSDEEYVVCFSTHGGAGYASGSYYDDGDQNKGESRHVVVCGLCRTRIQNPTPIGGIAVYYKWHENFWGWLKGSVKWYAPIFPPRRGEWKPVVGEVL